MRSETLPVPRQSSVNISIISIPGASRRYLYTNAHVMLDKEKIQISPPLRVRFCLASATPRQDSQDSSTLTPLVESTLTEVSHAASPDGGRIKSQGF